MFKRNGCVAMCLALVFSCGTAAAAESCSEIEDKMARLECYDAKDKEGKSEAASFKAAQELVAKDFLDPSSAQFRNLRIGKTRKDGKVTVCGEVNGKNSFGAYVGFRDFWTVDGFVSVEDPQGTPEARNFFRATKKAACGS